MRSPVSTFISRLPLIGAFALLAGRSNAGQSTGHVDIATATLASELAVAIAATMIFFVIGLYRERRHQDKLRVLRTTVADRIEDGRAPKIDLGADPDFSAISTRWNSLNEELDKARALQESQTTDAETISQFARKFQSASGRILALSRCDDFRGEIPETILGLFPVRFVRLWLAHDLLSSGPDALAPDETSAGDPEDQSPEGVLRKIGLFRTACAATRAEDKEAGKSDTLPAHGVVKTALGQTPVYCSNTRETSIFGDRGGELAERGFIAFIGIPMAIEGRILGVLEIYAESECSEIETAALESFSHLCTALISGTWSLNEQTRNRQSVELKNHELAMSNRKLARTNEMLAQADRVKNQFLANTSHELRTPMNSILGFAKLILSGSCSDEAEILSYVKTIQESGERLLVVINDVLDLARIEAGKMNLNLGPVDIRPQIDAVRALLEVQAGQRENEIRLEIPEQAPCITRADSTRLYQVLVNVTGNAVKFTKNGTITIRVHPEYCPGFMRVEVIDDGMGIAAEVQPKLFKSFVQGDGSATRQFGGTGLGLAISKRIVEMMGGAISIHSEGLGHGTTVTIDLPLWSDDLEASASTCGGITDLKGEAAQVSEAVKATQNLIDLSEARGRPTAIVIEDYLEYQLYLKEYLEERGWHVRTARTAAGGLDLIHHAAPTLVVLDMNLPSSDNDLGLQTGYDVIRVLSQDKEMNRIPVFVVTGMYKEACDQLLSQTVLVPIQVFGKPFEEDAFALSLERLMIDAEPQSGHSQVS